MKKFLLTRIAMIILFIMAVNCGVDRSSADANKASAYINRVVTEKSLQAAELTSAGILSAPAQQVSSGASSLPHARIYRTSGDFADNVPVGLSGDRSYLVSFPSPTDIKTDSRPIRLADGFLLDRCGIRPTTAFTTYTFDQYAAMKKAPQPAKLIDHVIPGSRVTEIVELPFAAGSRAAGDTTECNRLIREGLRGCRIIYRTSV